MALKPQSSLRRKYAIAEKLARQQLNLPFAHAWFLTDPARTPDPACIAQELPAGWGVIYRHFGAPDKAEIAAQLAEICRRRGLQLLIAADPQLAISINADGIHVPHRLLGTLSLPGKLVTTSAHSPQDIVNAGKSGVDAVFYSTVFPSKSKSASAPIGAERFRLLAQDSPVPLIALGGINAENVGQIAPYSFASISGVADAFAPRI